MDNVRDIKEIRDEIDITDNEILELFLKRMELAKEVAEYKNANGLPILNKQREREILSDVSNKSGDKKLYAHRFFSLMMDLSKAYQGEFIPPVTSTIETIRKSILPSESTFPKFGTVACQGVEGAYSGEAADLMFPCGDVMFMKSFDAVFDAVEDGIVQYGIVPLENSSGGSVRAVYDLLQKHNVSIIRSQKILVRHELLMKPGADPSKIEEIYSHEQAIIQCSKFLKRFGDKIKVIPAPNTAIAAKMVAESENPNVASISSHSCAELYGLKTVNDNIQNSENNYTRFVCISKTPQIFPGANKISLILTTPHKPGALYDILAKFSALGINLIKLESCPIPGHDFEFIFFLDIEASVNEPGVLSMISELEQTCGTFKFLGNYFET